MSPSHFGTVEEEELEMMVGDGGVVATSFALLPMKHDIGDKSFVHVCHRQDS